MLKMLLFFFFFFFYRDCYIVIGIAESLRHYASAEEYWYMYYKVAAMYCCVIF